LKEPHAVYVMRVTAGGSVWYVKKRYKEFKVAHDRLKPLVPAPGPTFPSNFKLGGFSTSGFSTSAADDGTIQYRRAPLELWANEVIALCGGNSGGGAGESMGMDFMDDSPFDLGPGRQDMQHSPPPRATADLLPVPVSTDSFQQLSSSSRFSSAGQASWQERPQEHPAAELVAEFFSSSIFCSHPDDPAAAVEAILPALPTGVSCELLELLGGGPLKQGWLHLEQSGIQALGSRGKRWTRRWFMIWPQCPHPVVGQLFFDFQSREVCTIRCVIPSHVVRHVRAPVPV
jgi:hypothetical protein